MVKLWETLKRGHWHTVSLEEKSSAAVLVDVDGTITPTSFPRRREDYYHSAWNGGHYFPQEVREFLMNLPADKYWCTSWEEEAEATFACGWPVLTPLQRDDYWWKAERVAHFLATTSYEKVVWLDDELPDLLKFDDFTAQGGRLLTIAPTHGLTGEHLRKIEAFLTPRVAEKF